MPGQQTIDSISTERRPRWLGDHQRPPQHALYWEVPGYKRDHAGRPRTNWRGVINQEGFGEDGTYLGRSSISSSQQTRITSVCDPMRPPGCGVNQGQGHGHPK